MTDSAIIYRKRIRERFDLTALHRSNDTNPVGNPDIIKLDVVSNKVTIFVPANIEVDIRGSIDGMAFFDISLGVIGPQYITYGDVATDNLIKIISIDHIGQASNGTIVLDNSLVGTDLIDGTDTFTLNDGVHPAVVFEFDEDDTPGVSPGNVAVPFENGNQAVGSLTPMDAHLLAPGVRDGDTFTLDDGVNPSTTFELDDNSSVSGPNIAIPFTQEVQATGTLTAVPQAPLVGLVDGDTFTLNPGSGPFIFEFDTDSVVAGGHIPVPIPVNGTAAQVKTAMINAIQGAAIGITATSGSGDVVNLSNDTPGTVGNIPITENINNTTLSPTGMSGGVDGDSAGTIASAMLTAINGVGAGLAITASITSTPRVDLINDAIGTVGNIAITQVTGNGSFSPVGMQSGMDVDMMSNIKANIISSINSASNLDITATSGAGGTINLLNDTVGTFGNQTITDTVATSKFSHTGMANGEGNSGSVTIAGV